MNGRAISLADGRVPRIRLQAVAGEQSIRPSLTYFARNRIGNLGHEALKAVGVAASTGARPQQLVLGQRVDQRFNGHYFVSLH